MSALATVERLRLLVLLAQDVAQTLPVEQPKRSIMELYGHGKQISEGYRRLEPAQDAVEALRYPKRSEIKARMDATIANVRESIEFMEQSNECQQLVSATVEYSVNRPSAGAGTIHPLHAL